MKYSIFKKLLHKYHEGKATDAEKFIVDSWYESYDHSIDQKGYNEIPEITEETGRRIFRKITTGRLRTKWYSRRWLQVAALLTLVFSALLALHLHESSNMPNVPIALIPADTVSTAVKQLKKLEFPDGSTVWLNAESRLIVMSGFGTTSRQLYLDGEGYFEVAPDSILPFEVITQGLTVRVLGTSFNVSAYQAIEDIGVSVNSGIVQVTDTSRGINTSLQADEGLRYSKSEGVINMFAVLNEDNNSWREGRIVLNRASYSELKQAFKNVYGKELTTDNEKIKSYRYNLLLRRDQDEADALEMISTMLETSYKQEENGTILLK